MVGGALAPGWGGIPGCHRIRIMIRFQEFYIEHIWIARFFFWRKQLTSVVMVCRFLKREAWPDGCDLCSVPGRITVTLVSKCYMATTALRMRKPDSSEWYLCSSLEGPQEDREPSYCWRATIMMCFDVDIFAGGRGGKTRHSPPRHQPFYKPGQYGCSWGCANGAGKKICLPTWSTALLDDYITCKYGKMSTMMRHQFQYSINDIDSTSLTCLFQKWAWLGVVD